MDKYGYQLKQSIEPKTPHTYYHKTDLELMTTFQRQEICTKEKIVQGMINPMDKEELFYRIYEGKEKCSLEYLPIYPIPLLNFEVRMPARLSVPIAVDFGTSNTTAGVFLD